MKSLKWWKKKKNDGNLKFYNQYYYVLIIKDKINNFEDSKKLEMSSPVDLHCKKY